jgi:hypothetical protein
MGLLAEEWGQVASVDRPEAEMGTAIHRAIFNQDSSTLTEDEARNIYSKLMRRLNEVIASWNATNDDLIIKEERLWMHNGILPVFSGQADYMRIDGRRGLIVDMKTGWSKPPEPKDNDQLKSLAVLMAIHYPQVELVQTQIISPNYRFIAHLMPRTEIEKYQKTLEDLLRRINEKTQPNPGDYCKHCKGLLICPAVRREASWVIGLDDGGDLPSVLPEGEKGAKILAAIVKMKKFIVAVEDYYKLMLAKNPSAVPGWGLFQGDTIRYFKDPEKTFDVLRESISEEDLWKAITISVGGIEKALPKGKSIPEDLLATKQNRPSLGKTKKS